MNQRTYTAVVKQSGGWWIGWIEEVSGVNCQEATRKELLGSLRISLAEKLAPPIKERRPMMSSTRRPPRHLSVEPEAFSGNKLHKIRVVDDRG